MNGQQARTELYHRLSEVIGPENATTLMSYLPYEPPATARDLEATESALRSTIEASETALRSEIGASGAALRSEIGASVENLRAELCGEIQKVDRGLRSEIQKVDSGLRAEIRVLNGRMDGFEERMGRFESRLDSFGDLLVTQARTYAISTVTAVVGSVGLAAGLASIL